ncbi:MAG: hypothetical protein EKK62_11185 [Acidimicrobiia bacterium]|nr:MAG: hypothetical protein EKK62_11185 [Acidimicrobiia bacterium]
MSPLAATCPSCEASPWSLCISGTGKELHAVHADRRRATPAPAPAIQVTDEDRLALGRLAASGGRIAIAATLNGNAWTVVENGKASKRTIPIWTVDRWLRAGLVAPVKARGRATRELTEAGRAAARTAA